MLGPVGKQFLTAAGGLCVVSVATGFPEHVGGAVAALQRRGLAVVAGEVEDELRRHFGALVFETTVPRSIRLAEAPSHGIPAIAYDRRSAGAEAYWKVAMELVERA